MTSLPSTCAAEPGEQRIWLILHTGAKLKALTKGGLKIEDPTGILQWLAKDRALMTIRDGKDLASKRAALKSIIKQWIANLPRAWFQPPSTRTIMPARKPPSQRSSSKLRAPSSRRRSSARIVAARKDPAAPISTQVSDALAALKRLSSKRIRDEMGPRYGVHVKNAFGVRVGQIQQLAKKIGRNHDLAIALWNDSGEWYEARMLAAFVDEPARVTPAQMDRWCRDFDNWGIVDTVCFKLFDQSPHAWQKVEPWSKRPEEFIKRAGFVLMACLAAHDRSATDAQFLALLPLIECGADDDRNFVKKGVSWALRMIGRRSARLRSASLALARRLVASDHPSQRWLGREAIRELA